MRKNITVIPATRNFSAGIIPRQVLRKKAAGYARVSTDHDEQFTSYTAQVDYYTQFIKSHADWEFVEVYTDEGISGTSTKRREGFNRMVEDALAGKIDIIVTKSVSRFARNTVDSLTTVRKLKEAGVVVFFEKENIWTDDSKGEVLITIMSSLAQEESRSISENVTWGKRKRFADGKVDLPYGRFLGYRKGADNLPEIVPEEAEVVRLIYRWFMAGKTPATIAKILTADGIRTPAGCEKWKTSTVVSILTNEKYKGDALLQKKFTVDFLTKKQKVNEGEVPQYYVENSHPAIIEPSEFDAVQAEMERRKNLGRRYSGQSILSARIVCGDCGDFFGPKVWHSNSKYRRVIWQCNSKFDDGHTCSTPTLNEEDVKARFLVAINSLIKDRVALIEDLRIMQKALTSCKEIDAQIDEYTTDMEMLTDAIRRHISNNATTAMDQEEYETKYNSLARRFDYAKKRYDELVRQKAERENKAIMIGGFMFEMMERDQPLKEFDDHLWLVAIDHVTAYHDGRLVFRFKSGLEVTA